VLAKAKGTVYKGRKPTLNAERIAQLREQAAAGGKPNKAGEKIAMCGRVEQSEAPRHYANALHAHISDQLKRLGGNSHSYNVAPAQRPWMIMPIMYSQAILRTYAIKRWNAQSNGTTASCNHIARGPINIVPNFFLMLYLILICFLALLIIGPSWWVKHTMDKYSEPANRYSFTGGQLARNLLDQASLQHVSVEVTELGDHYDPLKKTVRLLPDKFHGRSLTAITVAAHEVGHAFQDQAGYAPLALRTWLVQWAAPAEKLGVAILMLAPVIMGLSRSPAAGLLFAIGGMLTLGSMALVHALTLPMELNASFARALPSLERGRYLIEGDMPHARRLLSAAAWTYVAASLMTLLNMARWLAILRR